MKKEFVEHVLLAMGMPIKLTGFLYITDAVMLMDTPEWKNPKWTALYYKIGVMNGDTESKVERAIRNAFMTTRNKVSNYEMVEHYIGFTNCENSNSITFLYKNIKREYMKLQQEKMEAKTKEEDTEEVLQSFNEVTAEMIKGIVRQTLKEMLFEIA